MSKSWYWKNFPIDADLFDCRNCLEHEPPKITNAEDVVYCNASNTHTTVSIARQCCSFASYVAAAESVNEKKTKSDVETVMTLGDFQAITAEVQKEVDDAMAVVELEEKDEKKQEEAPLDWKPKSKLDDKILNFNDETVPAALRAIFDILTGMNKRLSAIEDKMPATKKWKTASYFSGKRVALRIWKNKLKYKMKYKFGRMKAKTKTKSAGLAALFSPDKEKKKEEKAEEKTEVKEQPNAT